MIRFAIVALCAAVLGAKAAECQQVRYPADGKPAIALQLPQGWKVDQGAPRGMAVYSNKDGSTHLQVIIGRDAGSFEEMAGGIAQGVNGLRSMKRGADLKVDGFLAASFDLDVSGAGGRPFRIKMILVRLDPLWAMNITQTFGAGISAQQEADAASILASAKLIAP